MKEVLVLGGGGFIGRNIVEYLVNRKDCQVTAADIREGSNWSKIVADSGRSRFFKSVLDDFSKESAFDKLDRQFDEIYMLAAVVGVNRTLKDPAKVIGVNTKLTMNVLDWVAKQSVQRILFASSSENYAATTDLFDAGVPTPESIPLCIGDIKHPRWTYAITKMHGELAFFHSAKALNYAPTIVRYQNIIGPEMGFGHAIPHIVERFASGACSPFKIYGHDQTRAFCYVDDAVRGTVEAMESDAAKDQIYHIGNREEINMDQLTTYIGGLMEYMGAYEPADTYPGSVGRRCPNIDKAVSDFGYSPKIGWKEAVRLTVEWYQEFFASGKTPVSGGFEPPEKILESMMK